MRGEEEGLPGGAGGKEPIANAGEWRDLGLIPGWGRSPGGGHGNPLQYSCLENPIDRGAWQGTVHGVAKSDTPEWPNTHARRGGAWPEDQSPLGADMEVEGPGACAEGGGPFPGPLGSPWSWTPRPVREGTGPRLRRGKRWGLRPGEGNELALF